MLITVMIKTIDKDYLLIENKGRRENQKNEVVNKKILKMIIEEIQNREKEESVKGVI
jgi:hypothetical protein